ncbi:MAG: nitrilase-related carbon-nitrogen hydrolase [Planctomycetota bacterium]|jgi:apolipoprotein N-acyltransferase
MAHIAFVVIAVFGLAQGPSIDDIRAARAKEYETLLVQGFRVFCHYSNQLHHDDPEIVVKLFPGGNQPWICFFIDAIGLGSVGQNRDSWLRGDCPAPFRVDQALGTGQYRIAGTETIEGNRRCIVLERNGLDKLWLDEERGYAVVRREWRWGVDKPLWVRIRNGDFRAGPAGVWLPRDVRIEYFGIPENDPNILCVTIQSSVEKIEFAPNTDYMPSYHGSLITYKRDHISFIIPSSESNFGQTASVDRTPIRSRLVLYIPIVGGLVVLVAVIGLVFLRRRISFSEFMRGFIYLGLAAVFLPFSNGRWPVAFAAWLAPVFLVRFLRTQQLLPGLILGGLVFMVASFVHWWEILPLDGWRYFAFAGLLVQGLYLIYVIDRLVSPRLGGLKATFVLPATWVSLEYLALFVSPYGSWGSVAYTQFGFLSFWQILSVTGTAGIAFLIGWFAAIVNYSWEEGLLSRKSIIAIVTYGSVFVAIIGTGQVRLRFFPPVQPTVRVASISVLEKLTTDQERDYMLEQSRREAEAGAKIVLWPEVCVYVSKDEQEEFFGRASKLARQARIYLAMGMSASGDRFVFIDPNGDVLFNRRKQIVVPGLEDEWYFPALRNVDPLPVIDTPYGQITGPICFEGNFPWYVRQPGRSKVSIILSPSNDWKAMSPWHTYIACTRGVELGSSVVRHAEDGFSMAVDYQGRVLATMDHFTTPDGQRVMVSQVPTSGVNTFYGRYGDIFSWVSILVLAGLIVLSLKGSLRLAE